MRLMDRIFGRNRNAETSAGPVVQAQALAAAGSYAEAIALATRENRANRSRELDSLIRQLRSDGFNAGAWQKEVPQWPENVPDRYEGQTIPEIGVEELSADAIRSGIDNHGSIIVRNMIKPEQVDLLRDNIDRVLAAYDEVESGNITPELAGWYEPYEPDTVTDRVRRRRKGSILTIDSPPAMFDLLEVFEDCGLSAAARDFFGEPPALLARKGTLRKVPHDTRTGGWHQDGGFLGEEIRSLNIWLALTDCGETAPGMDIVAKRLPGIVQTGSNFAQWATNPEAAAKVSEGCTERPIFRPGDAILFDHICLHRTGTSPGMTDTRYAIETWMLGPSTYNTMGLPVLF